MKKIFLLLTIFIMPCSAIAEEYSYVSPESYAVNEADLLDYMNIPRSPKLDIDELYNPQKHVKQTSFEQKPQKVKEQKIKTNTKTYEDTLQYKAAKWWVDQRYKREEVHHGQKHEIKVQKRIENEQN